MAAPTCGKSVLATCRLLRIFERLLPTGISVSRPYTTHSYSHGEPPSRVGPVGSLSSAWSHCQPVVCEALPSAQLTPHRHLSWYTDRRISLNLGAKGVAKVDPDITVVTDRQEGQDLAQKVNTSLEQGQRLFAVVAISGLQRKITVEDILVIETEFPPTVGDRLRLEKVLMVGGKDFSLLGQPLLSRDQVRVEATVIEKTLSHNRIWSTYKPRKRFRKLKLFRTPQTMLVINSIQLNPITEQRS